MVNVEHMRKSSNRGRKIQVQACRRISIGQMIHKRNKISTFCAKAMPHTINNTQTDLDYQIYIVYWKYFTNEVVYSCYIDEFEKREVTTNFFVASSKF